jgi:hypothetical protein
VYIIIFYIMVFVVFVIIIDFLYVSISYRHKKISFTQPIQLLKIACLLIVTVLFIPITGITRITPHLYPAVRVLPVALGLPTGKPTLL